MRRNSPCKDIFHSFIVQYNLAPTFEIG